MNVFYKNLNKQNEVTGSFNYLEIHVNDKITRIVIDYGATQDNTLSFSRLYNINANQPLIDFKDVQYVILSHFHNDHVGLFGRLSALEFEGRILCTQLTTELASINLRDSAHLHTKEIEKQNENKKRKKGSRQDFIPLYTSKSVEDVIEKMQGYSYYKEVHLTNDIILRFLPAGHVSGGAMIELVITEGNNTKKLLFSGDNSGFRDIPFTKKPNFDVSNYHTVWMESTYGNRLIEEEDTVEQLYKYIKNTCVDKQGVLFIPSFAMSRSTNIAHYMKLTYEKYPELSDIPIYMASPMMVKTHRVLGKPSSFEFYDEKWLEYGDLFQWDKMNYIESFTKVQEQLITKEPKIIIASSGMLCSGYANFLMQQFLPQKNACLLLCGYCAEGTPSRVLFDGIQKTISVTDDEGKKIKVPIRAEIHMLKGMSSHGSYQDMIDMLNKFEKKKLKKIIINHGNEDAKIFFKKKLEESFDSEVIISQYGDKIKII